jgi:hypothetical protein
LLRRCPSRNDKLVARIYHALAAGMSSLANIAIERRTVAVSMPGW